jgi:hypothetical protein
MTLLMKLQVPSARSQEFSRFQAPNAATRVVLGWSTPDHWLGVVDWNFFGVWDLDIGAL